LPTCLKGPPPTGPVPPPDAMPAKKRARLEPQGVARAKACRANVRIAKQFLCEILRGLFIERNFKSIFARVAGAGNMQFETVPLKGLGRHERHRGNLIRRGRQKMPG